jgi:uncharacterized membrane protein
MPQRNKLFFVFMLIALSAPSLAQDAPTQVSSSPMALTLAMRWIHILSAITMMGGSVFIGFILRGAAAEALDEASRQALIASVRKRWKRAVMLLTTLLLVSGFYNYLMVTRFAHDGQPQYHMMFGIKFLLSLAVFALAMFLVGSSGLGKKLQASEGAAVGVLIALATAVVLVAGYMKVM